MKWEKLQDEHGVGSRVWMQGTMVFLVECLQVSRQGRTSWEDPGPGE